MTVSGDRQLSTSTALSLLFRPGDVRMLPITSPLRHGLAGRSIQVE